MALKASLTGVILAGGASRRFGRDKAAALLDGRPLLEWVATALAPACNRMVAVGPAGRAWPHAGVDLEIVDDLFPGEGPLGGMISAFRRIGHGHAFVSACDTPFLQPADVIAIAACLSEGVAAAVPRARDALQPLAAAYDVTSCLPALESLFEAGERRVQALFSQVRVVEVDAEALSERAFDSLDTPEALAEAAARIALGEAPRSGNPARG
jgi:molybdopterin-guanine dinucleotide biosynthesis protein A